MDLTIFQIAAGIFLGGVGLMAFRYGMSVAFQYENERDMPTSALLCCAVPPLAFALFVWLGT